MTIENAIDRLKARFGERVSTAEAIRDVGVGEAVTSMLQKKGVPGIVERTLIRPPSSKLGPIDAATRGQVMAASPLAGRYDTTVDRKSAYEILTARSEEAAKEAEVAEEQAEEQSAAEQDKDHRR